MYIFEIDLALFHNLDMMGPGPFKIFPSLLMTNNVSLAVRFI